MKGTIVTIKPDGSLKVQEVSGPPTLDLLQRAIGGGYLQVVPGFGTIWFRGANVDCIAFADEEGKLKDQPFNLKATAHWARALQLSLHSLNDNLVGDIAIVMGDREFLEAL